MGDRGRYIGQGATADRSGSNGPDVCGCVACDDGRVGGGRVYTARVRHDRGDVSTRNHAGVCDCRRPRGPGL